MDKLSVLVTCYNKREYVEPCFKFLNELSELGAEIVIIDDGSTDGSSGLIEKQMFQMSRKPVLRTTENRGLAAARDLAIETAKSDFIYCLDIDDTPNVNSLAEIVQQLSSSTASACAGNFWYIEQNAPGTPVVETAKYIIFNSSGIRENIFDARGWWRYVYRRDFLMLPGNRFGNVFKSLYSESFVLDDIYWMLHLASQDFELLIAPANCYVTNYLLPSHNAELRWSRFIHQVTLLPQATQAFVESLNSHTCVHEDTWMYKKLFYNLCDHMTIIPMSQQLVLAPKLFLVSKTLLRKLNYSNGFVFLVQLLLLPMRRMKRKLYELKTH